MKTLVWCIGLCVSISLEGCFCKKDMLDDVQERVKQSSHEPPCVESLPTVKQSKIFFEEEANKQKLPHINTQKSLGHVSSQSFLQENNQEGNEAPYHKELREAFDRGEFDQAFDLGEHYSSRKIGACVPEKSEESVTLSVITELMFKRSLPQKTFSEIKSKESYDLLCRWFACMSTYGIGIPDDYKVAYHCLKKCVQKKKNIS